MADRLLCGSAALIAGAVLAVSVAGGEAPVTDVAAWRARVEADWLHPEMLDQVRGAPPKATRKGPAGVTAVQDAAGGVDGRKTGEWGFHTAHQKHPWWHVDLGEALACIGCHERRDTAPAVARPLAMAREPSRLTPGPEGSWPLRFDRLVQPVLDRHCAGCHKPGGKDKAVAKLDLTPKKAYASLTNYGGKQGIGEYIVAAYKQATSVAGAGAGATSPILRILTEGKGHNDVKLSRDDLERLTTWLDLYGQYLGSFSPEQEQRLIALRGKWTDLLEPR